MADIFISYAREDAVRAAALAAAFEAVGWSVWFDDAIRAGAPYDAVIDQQLDAAACVVVIWSRASVDSSWVRAEASEADQQAKLVPVTLSRSTIAVQFRQIRVSHLTSTEIRELTPEARNLLADVARLTGRPPSGIDLPTGPRDIGVRIVTVGGWRLTTRFLGMEGRYDLKLHPNSTVTGKGKWAISRVDIAGRWSYDPAAQVLFLEMSGGYRKAPRRWSSRSLVGSAPTPRNACSMVERHVWSG